DDRDALAVVAELGVPEHVFQRELRVLAVGDPMDEERRPPGPQTLRAVPGHVDDVRRPALARRLAPDRLLPLDVPKLESLRAPGEKAPAVIGQPEAEAHLAVEMPEALPGPDVDDSDAVRVGDREALAVGRDGHVRARAQRSGAEQRAVRGPDFVSRGMEIVMEHL